VSAVIGLLEEKANDQDPILIVQPPKRKPDLGFTKVGTVAAAIAAATVTPNGHGQGMLFFYFTISIITCRCHTACLTQQSIHILPATNCLGSSW
jgi:hypothetical protein